jgi:hypothetical protein
MMFAPGSVSSDFNSLTKPLIVKLVWENTGIAVIRKMIKSKFFFKG